MRLSTVASASIAVTCLTLAAWPLPQSEDDPRLVTDSLLAMRDASLACDRDETAARAAVVMSRAPEGSDAWLEGAAQLALSNYHRERMPEVLALNRVTTDIALEREHGGIPGAPGRRERFGPLTPDSRGSAATVALAAGRVHQAEGQHEQSLRYFEQVIQYAQSQVSEIGVRNLRRALLDQAQSLLALGRGEEAAATLRGLYNAHLGSIEAAHAMVLLQHQPDEPDELGGGLGAYRGIRYHVPEHRGRMEALLGLVPRARELAAAGLGKEPSFLEGVLVGVADQPHDLRHARAVTLDDPRRKSLPPVVVIFAEYLAEGAEELEAILVHEFVHAALHLEFGAPSEDWPPWLSEGLPRAISGQWESELERMLERRLIEEPERFGADDFWTRHPLRIEALECGRPVAPEEELALIGVGGPEVASRIPAFLAHLRAGLALAEAFERAFGVGLQRFPEIARRGLEQALEARRAAALPWIHPIVAACAEGPAATLRAADEVLAAPNAERLPPLARGFALWRRAEALEAAGRNEEAESAYGELIAERRPHASYHDSALTGRVRCAINLGRFDEAEAMLRRILHETSTTKLAEWAQRELTVLPHRARR